MASLQEILSVSGSLKNAESIARQLSKKDPKFLLDLQLVLSAQGKISEAWEVSNRAFKLFPHDPRVAFDRGWLVMQQGRLLEGFCLMDKGRYAKLWGNAPLPSPKPIFSGKQDIKGKTVLYYNEAGLGDEIVHVRFVKMIAEQGARVIVAADNSLMSIFARIPQVSAVIDKRAALSVYHDFWLPSMSAAKVCQVEYENLDGSPYLLPSDSFCQKWSKIIQSDNFKVGIRWSGNPQFEYDQHRSIPPEKLISLSEIPHTQFYSFQRDSDLTYLPENIIDLRNQLLTWEDTAAALSKMDLVVTSCTSIAHMSAALGKPTWVIVPIMPYYVWVLPGNSTPWYNSVRLFRQTDFGNWDSVFLKVKSFLSRGFKWTW